MSDKHADSQATFHLIRNAFRAAYAAPAADRSAILDRECAGSADAREQAEALLRSFDEAGDFLGGRADDPRRSPPPLPVPAAGGAVLSDRYVLVRSLGEGGMGEVWLAEQMHPVRRAVAVKLLRLGCAAPQAVGRFEVERQALAWMDHPNIAKVLDGGTADDGRPYLVMELISGEPLVGYCDRHRLGLTQRLDVFRQVCAAVQHAHQKGIIHRDLKPSNILVEEVDGQPIPKVIDFGLAKVFAPDRRIGATTALGIGSVLGTPQYMAPEQLDAAPTAIDTRADVYALGCVLYELLTGTPPLTDEWLAAANLEQVLAEIRMGEPPRPSDRVANSSSLPSFDHDRPTSPRDLARRLRSDLDRIVLKALAKEPARRYETASALGDDVGRHLRGEPVSAVPPTRGYRFRKFVRRNRGQTVAAAIVAVSLLAGTIGTAIGMIRADNRRIDAERSATKARDATAAEAEARLDADRQRIRVAAEADAAVAVNDLLLSDGVGRLGRWHEDGIDGNVRVNPNLTVREVLDRAALKVGTKYADRPRTEAAVRYTLGSVYHQLGHWEAAIPHLERAAELHRTHRPVLSVDQTDGLYLLGIAHDELCHADRAKTIFLELVAAERGYSPPRSLYLVRALQGLAELYLYEENFAEALALLREARPLAESGLGPNHFRTSLVDAALARLDARTGNPARAKALLLQVAERRAKTFGEDHPHTLGARYELAELAREFSDPKQALALYEQELGRQKAVLGADHPLTLKTMFGLASCHNLLGRTDLALATYRDVQRRWRKTAGPTARETLVTLSGLAACLHKSWDVDASTEASREVYAGLRVSLGPGHPQTALAAYNLANMYFDVGRFDQAIPLYRAAEGYLLPPRNRNTRQAIILITKLALCYERERMYEDGRDRLREYLSVVQLRPDVRGQERLSLLFSLAEALNRLRGYADVEAALRDCIRDYPPDAKSPVALVQSQLGVALLGQGKCAEAEPVLLAAYEDLDRLERGDRARGAFYRAQRMELGAQIVALYAARNQPSAVAEWRAKVPCELAPAPRPR
ncbi:serine threonine protein kinase : Putative serine/threonine protein kinase OS=Gemmata sp. Wa1-1 PE=3 SV=1: Pkinase: TPR_2: TPR_10: TPR_12: TPR_12 [Gemmata massiliana]|uniref:Protein kinase domain-containing protein n=1 Tax=Gemmata massiliana TaxID=1210884 RepID=A0A6P2CZ80_9BACT|nr:serine/threonine-protein kinase [Gemmata massiliana]VTR92462.1 serine threonine protein kinase : Putative serine/threonine protein kinase OS=Gemmata sp. Wa1-1 PE=3 SV=1: Pkinase: TPR_2: TPR_10: TPR_12: TPR_12 [Gemmata massiliana]